MSVYATIFVWETSKSKSTALLTLLAIADYADEETGEAFPGITKLCEKLRMKERNAQYLIHKLETDGEIIISEHKGLSTPSGRTNRYALVGYKEWYKEVQNIASLKRQGVQNPVTRGAILGSEGVQGIAPNPSVEPSENHIVRKSARTTIASEKMNPVKDAIAAAFHYDWATMTGAEKGCVQKAAKELILANVTADDISGLYAYCAQRFTSFKAMALATNVSEWRKSQPKAAPAVAFDLSKWTSNNSLSFLDNEG